jgi:hypothetical protein
MSESTVPPPVMTGYHAKAVEGWELYLHALNTLTDATPEEIAKWDDLIIHIREILSLVRSIVNGEIIPVPRKGLKALSDVLYLMNRDMAEGRRVEFEKKLHIVQTELARWLTPDTSKESAK